MTSPEERVVFCHRYLPKALAEDADVLGAAHVWSRTVAGRLHAAGAEVLAHAGATVLATFDASDLADAIEVGLDLLDEADEAQIPVGLGVALGLVQVAEGADVVYGGSIERAQVLASRVPPGEIALDGETRARAKGLLLFAKQISPGHGLRGYLVDRTYPRRDASALAMKRLGEPALPPATRALLSELGETIARVPHPVVVLRGPPGAGAVELIEEARRSAGGRAHLFTVPGTPSAAVPLGSLRSMIATFDLVERAVPAQRAVLALVAEGVLPSRAELASALALTLPDPAWLFLAPLAEIDFATLGVLGALAAERPDILLVARHGMDLPLPLELTTPRLGAAEPIGPEKTAHSGHPARIDPGESRSGREVAELTLPALRTSDAKLVAESVLGEGCDPEVARKVAVLGGETSLGVLEAARALVACGELVRNEDRFVFRANTDRATHRQKAAVALDRLIAERAEMLDDESRKCIEAIAILAEPVAVAELEAVAHYDGVSGRGVARALGRLDDDGWVERQAVGGAPSVRCANVYVRRLLETNLHPARRAELHRFAYAALENRRDGPIGDVELGLHLVHAGREKEGGQRLVSAAEATLGAGYGRAAARIALLAQRADAELGARGARVTSSLLVEGEGGFDVEGAEAAPALAPDVEDLKGPDTGKHSVPPMPGASLNESVEMDALEMSREVAQAIRDRDAERIEHIARRAVLEGVGMAEVARLRALADLLRGDLGGAARSLVKARSLLPSAAVGRRALLTEAMVALRAGAATTAVRFGLRALAEARSESDARGESVALFVMAASYRALGRDEDASRLEQRGQP